MGESRHQQGRSAEAVAIGRTNAAGAGKSPETESEETQEAAMNRGAQRPMTTTEWGLLLLLSLLWGGSFFFVGIAVKALPPFTIVAARVTIAAALLWLAAPLTGVSALRLGRQAPALLALALLNNVAPFSLLTWSQTHLASGFVSILNATTPVFTVVVAHLYTIEEKLDPRRLAGALIGLAGVAAMIGPALLGGFANHLVAELAALLAALSYAAASVFARRFRRLGLTPIDVATGQVTASSLALLPLAALVDVPWRLPAPGGAAIAAIVSLGALSTALAYVVYFRILAGAGATNVVLVTLLAPATAILLGAVVLGESLAARDFVGLGLIALGLAVIDGRLTRAARARLAPAGRR
jgi:drug/metabolite transporter (DMT)-like permease